MRTVLPLLILAVACGPIDESGAPSIIPPAPDGGTVIDWHSSFFPTSASAI